MAMMRDVENDFCREKVRRLFPPVAEFPGISGNGYAIATIYTTLVWNRGRVQ